MIYKDSTSLVRSSIFFYMDTTEAPVFAPDVKYRWIPFKLFFKKKKTTTTNLCLKFSLLILGQTEVHKTETSEQIEFRYFIYKNQKSCFFKSNRCQGFSKPVKTRVMKVASEVSVWAVFTLISLLKTWLETTRPERGIPICLLLKDEPSAES